MNYERVEAEHRKSLLRPPSVSTGTDPGDQIIQRNFEADIPFYAANTDFNPFLNIELCSSKGGYIHVLEELSLQSWRFFKEASTQTGGASGRTSFWAVALHSGSKVILGRSIDTEQKITREIAAATKHRQSDARLRTELRWLVESSQNEVFEDGIQSEFSERLTDLLRVHGADALPVIRDLLLFESNSYETVAEALRILGRVHDEATETPRLSILRHALRHNSPVVRDGAALGIAFLGNSAAAPDLREAISREQDAELKQSFEQILAEFSS